MKTVLLRMVLVVSCLSFTCCTNWPAGLPNTLSISLTGDEANLFKVHLSGGDFTTSSPPVQASPATWTLILSKATADVLVYAFIDANGNGVRDERELCSGSWFTVVRDTANQASIQLGKSIITVSIVGNPGIFTHPMLVHNPMGVGSSSRVVAPCASGVLTTYGNLTGKYGASGFLSAFDDLNGNNWYDFDEPTISTETIQWEYAATRNVSLTLMSTAPQILPNEQKIDLGVDSGAYYPADPVHYRYIDDLSSGRVRFLIPVGAGTDGAFIKCYQCETDPPRSTWHSGDHLWKVFDLVYASDPAKRSRVMGNYFQQLVEWKQNIKDVVLYLEGSKGFTVFGKETLPSSW